MNLGLLNQTVILIDTDYLNSRITDNLEFYKDLYPDKLFQEIKLADLLYQFVLNARIEEAGHTVDVLFAYTLSNSILSFCIPKNVFDFIDVHNATITTDKGTLRVRSFFAEEGETSIRHFINMLRMVYRGKMVSRIIIVADNEELNFDLQIMHEKKEKSLFMVKNGSDSEIEVPIKYVMIDYPIAYSLGLNEDEL